MSDYKKKCWLWSEGGDLYIIEDGDTKPSTLGINIYDDGANEYIGFQILSAEESGYKVEIGKPEFVDDDWQINMINEPYIGED